MSAAVAGAYAQGSSRRPKDPANAMTSRTRTTSETSIMTIMAIPHPQPPPIIPEYPPVYGLMTTARMATSPPARRIASTGQSQGLNRLAFMTSASNRLPERFRLRVPYVLARTRPQRSSRLLACRAQLPFGRPLVALRRIGLAPGVRLPASRLFPFGHPFSFTSEVNEDHEEESDGHPRGRPETSGRKDVREETNHDEGHGESDLGGGREHLDSLPCRRCDDNVRRRCEQSDR